jgi:hypothetical protein
MRGLSVAEGSAFNVPSRSAGAVTATGPCNFFHPPLLDFQSNPCNNYSVLQDGSGGVFVWRKFDCKRVNPSRTHYGVSNARCNRKTLSRRLSATPSI